jgi:hypothetical protein
MVDSNKKIEVTEDFLEKHRNNTRKYMHLLNNTNEKSGNLQETLSRIESKFGVCIKRSQSLDRLNEGVKDSDPSLQEFIQQIRQKYLAPADPLPLPLQNPLITEPLIDLSASIPKTPSEPPKPLDNPLKTLETPLENLWNPPQTILDLQIPPVPLKPQEKKDTALKLSDLSSETPTPQLSPYSKPPRSKHFDDLLQEIPEKEDNNKTFNENSMSMSFRRIHAEQILNNAISDIITSRLKIHKKKNSPKNPPNKIFSFENFLNAAKNKYAPLKKTVSIEQVYKQDNVLQNLLTRKSEIISQIEAIQKEKEKLLKMMEL